MRNVRARSHLAFALKQVVSNAYGLAVGDLIHY